MTLPKPRRGDPSLVRTRRSNQSQHKSHLTYQRVRAGVSLIIAANKQEIRILKSLNSGNNGTTAENVSSRDDQILQQWNCNSPSWPPKHKRSLLQAKLPSNRWTKYAPCRGCTKRFILHASNFVAAVTEAVHSRTPAIRTTPQNGSVISLTVTSFEPTILRYRPICKDVCGEVDRLCCE